MPNTEPSIYIYRLTTAQVTATQHGSNIGYTFQMNTVYDRYPTPYAETSRQLRFPSYTDQARLKCYAKGQTWSVSRQQR